MEPVSVDTVRFVTADGVELEGDVLNPPEPSGAAVVCHPHPLYGGTRNDQVVGSLCRTLVGAGIRVLRFDFRGAGGSSGSHGGGPAEQQDVAAALDRVATDGMPLILAGYSFGADLALSVDDPRVRQWIAVAPVLSVFPEFAAASDPRPKTLIAAAHDQFRSADDLTAAVAAWPATTVVEIESTDHFFGGRLRALDQAVGEALG